LQVTIATDLGKMVTRMQLERSEVAFFIYTNGNTLRHVPFEPFSLRLRDEFAILRCALRDPLLI